MTSKRPANGWNIRRLPVHPCEMLREGFLIPLDLPANRLAMERTSGWVCRKTSTCRQPAKPREKGSRRMCGRVRMKRRDGRKLLA